MLETVGQFRLHYSDQDQGALRSLVATSSLLNRVLSPKDRTQRYHPLGIGYSQVQVTKVGSSTQMVVFGIGDGLWFLS